jgi:hypothetical protein
MPQVFQVKFGNGSSEAQAQAMQALKNCGAAVIQLSDGLAVKSDKSAGDLKVLLEEKKIEFGLEKVDSALANDENTPKDLRAFLKDPS